MKRLRRSYPYIMFLHNRVRENKDKMTILRSLPDFVAADVIELLYNILQGNCHVTKQQIAQIKKQRKSITNIYKSIQNSKSQKSRKNLLYKQKGGFIGSILPIVASIASGLVGSAL